MRSLTTKEVLKRIDGAQRALRAVHLRLNAIQAAVYKDENRRTLTEYLRHTMKILDAADGGLYFAVDTVKEEKKERVE